MRGLVLLICGLAACDRAAPGPEGAGQGAETVGCDSRELDAATARELLQRWNATAGSDQSGFDFLARHHFLRAPLRRTVKPAPFETTFEKLTRELSAPDFFADIPADTRAALARLAARIAATP
jgi:hypothetical protein